MESKFTISAMGIGAFGPVDPDLKSETYGCITTTPKKGWNNYNIVGELKQHFSMPMGFDTDVNAAALGEHYLGAAKGYNDFIYITVGTGIGAGIMSNGKIIHGDMHPELGHVFVPQDK
jgi:fructokinase